MNIRRILQRVILAGIIVASIYFGFQNLRAAIAVGNLKDDPVTAWEVRFQPVKKLLPFKRGAIGFLQNSDVLARFPITMNRENIRSRNMPCLPSSWCAAITRNGP